MRIPGHRIKRTRLIQAEKYVVAVEVEMVVPVDDPSEPCYESETVELLREIKEHAEGRRRFYLSGPTPGTPHRISSYDVSGQSNT